MKHLGRINTLVVTGAVALGSLALAVAPAYASTAGLSAAAAPAVVCSVHGCYQITVTGDGTTQVAAENAAVAIMLKDGCHLLDVAVNDFQALPGGTWQDRATGVCLGATVPPGSGSST
jgi:hypothetical protein